MLIIKTGGEWQEPVFELSWNGKFNPEIVKDEAPKLFQDTPPKTFLDAYNREIKIGDVVVSGGRSGSSGHIKTCIVTGFTAESVTVLAVHEAPDSWDTELQRHTKFMFKQGYLKNTSLCVITPYTQETLTQSLAM